MSNWLVEKRLSVAAERLKRLRNELQVVDEQLAALADSADELRIRSLVSETPLADREHQEAQKHADAMARHRAEVVASIADLERSRDELLDQLLTEQR
jgi:uncharacterized coiled-coil DUF342 family protein